MKTISWQCAECKEPKLEKLLLCEKHLKEEYERYDREGFDMKTNKDIEAKRLGNSAKGPEESHTPTPWHRNTNAKYPIYAGEAPNHEIVAFVDSKNPQAEENLRLIIRAVNSHEALLVAFKDMSRAYHDIVRHASYFHNCNVPWCVDNRSIVAKAEGNV